MPAFSYEAGLLQRAAIVEFASLEAAHSAYISPEYQATVKHLDGAVERDVRIIQGV